MTSSNTKGDVDKAALAAKLAECGQSHLLDHYDELTDTGRTTLAAFIMETDLEHLNRVLDTSLAALEAAKQRPPSTEVAVDSGDGDDICPPPAAALFDVSRERRMRKIATCPHPDRPTRYGALEARGHELIADGQAAVLLLAGGSGTRLGVSYPKGLFAFGHEVQTACGPLLRQSTKSLFQLHCERLRKAEMLAHAAVAPAGASAGAASSGAPRTGQIQLLVMTSEQNDAQTRRFFADHNYFGLCPDQIHFFTQTSLPVYAAEVQAGDVDARGRPVRRILMEAPGQVSRAPGGNGGVYQSLTRGRDEIAGDPAARRALPSVLDVVERKGVRYVQIFSVDNLLAKVADPLFYGYTAARACEVAVKTTPKASPDERVGVFAKIRGRWGVVEYTELGEHRAKLRAGGAGATEDSASPLLFNCANIACHCCSVSFLRLAAEKMAGETMYHAAIKRVKLGADARECTAVKLEAFIFDMFRYCSDVVGKAPSGKARRATQGESGASAGTESKADETVKKTRRGGSKSTASRTNPDRFGILQVDRTEEFAPIKNATEAAATDNPRTAAQLYLRLTTRWARAALRAGAKRMKAACAVAPDRESSGSVSGAEENVRRLRRLRLAAASLREGDGEGGVLVEVSPLISYAGEGLAAYEDYLIAEVLKARAAAKAEGRRCIVLLDESVAPYAKM